MTQPLTDAELEAIERDWKGAWPGLRTAREQVSRLVEEVRRLRRIGRDLAGMAANLPNDGHEGDEETGGHDPDCAACLVDAIRACAETIAENNAQITHTEAWGAALAAESATTKIEEER